jgi:hypothetical protein
MSSNTLTAERDKYYHLLQLARAQVRALEMDEMADFDRIMRDKDIVIRSFGGTQGLVALDPALPEIARQIQNCDTAATRLLYGKLGRIKRRMTDLKQYQAARSAYRTMAGHPADRAASVFAAGVPRFIDRKL